MESKRILIIGGAGYIGSELTKELKADKLKVTILDRVSSSIPGVLSIEADIINKEQCKSYIRDVDMVILLASVIRTIKKKQYRENIDSLNNVLEAMKENKVPKLIYFSTQNVLINTTGPYGNSKKECEKILKETTVQNMILRPNYVYGVDKRNDFFKIAKMMKRYHIYPTIGKGTNKIQPINKKDVVRLTYKCIKEFKAKKIVNLSGKTTISINEITNYLKKRLKCRALNIRVPTWLLKPLQLILPFDLKGFDQDRAPKDMFGSPKESLFHDLDSIANLVIDLYG